MRLRVASVGFKLEAYDGFEGFAAKVRRHVRFAADAGASLTAFPEYTGGGLLARDPSWAKWVADFDRLFTELAKTHNMTIVAGTIPVTEGKATRNVAQVYGPGGRVVSQAKLHMTPCEKAPWRFDVGERIKLFSVPTAGGAVKAAVLICYDVEFPEAVRAAVKGGAELIIVPSWTDDEHGFWRVRHCTAARCVENYVYAVHSPLIGGLADVPFFEQAVGAAAILSPCDIAFPPRGVVSSGGWNEEVCVVGELDFGLTRAARDRGSVTPLKDLRSAGYECE